MDIIYIEDDEIEAQIFGLGLSKRGINVLHIPNLDTDGLDDLNTPDYRHARAVFFDMFVGTVNGMELARLLRERGDQRPFFLITAGENPNPDMLDKLNMTYLRKPIDFKAVAQSIQTIAQ
jgi:DNA-binding response OmpR family regulator